jgi:hypothetical protein
VSTIRIDDDSRPVSGSVQLDLFVWSERVNIQTKEWVAEPMVSARYDLEIVVDNDSGEDGALAPTVSVRTLSEEDFRLKLPLGGELVLEPDEGHWEAVLGNDSWGLERNRMTIRDFDGHTATITWSAVYGHQEEHAFLFEGVAAFKGILVWADANDDLDRAIGDLWGSDVLSRLTRTDVKVDNEVSPPRWSAWYRFK